MQALFESFSLDKGLDFTPDVFISIQKMDLDDGVKVNYAKFGELLADVKKIAGVKDESTD